MTKTRLQRREMLRGMISGVGVALALPLLNEMLTDNGDAMASDRSPLPNRLGVFFWGNGRGVDATKWDPATTGPDFELSPHLAPLQGVKRYLNIPTNMSCKTTTIAGHHHGVAAMLTGGGCLQRLPQNALFSSTLAMPTIDQVAASHIGTTTPFRSLEVGISEYVIPGQGTTLSTLSHNGPDNVNPPELSPAAMYDRLFATDEGSQPGLIEVTRDLRASALDAVWNDTRELAARLGSQDRARLEQHMQNVRDVESRLQAEPSEAACVPGERPDAYPFRRSGEPLAERMAAMSDLLALALSCDLTRVFSVMFTGPVSTTTFWQVGAKRIHHDLSHDGAVSQEIFDACTIFTMEQLAVLLQRFADTPDGDGNLLDHMVVLATSELSDGSIHSVENMPIVLAGGGNGFLKSPGVHYRGDHDNTTDVLFTALRAAGVPLTQFGSDGGETDHGVAAFEA